MPVRSPQILHFDYMPQTADWILRLMTKLQQSNGEAARNMHMRWAQEHGETAGAIATKSRIVDFIAQRVRDGLTRLAAQIENDKDAVAICLQMGAAYRLPDGLPFSLVADIDGLIFEQRSTYELTVRFIWAFLRDLGSTNAHPSRTNFTR